MEALEAARIVVPGVRVQVVDRCASTNSMLLLYTSRTPVLLAAEEQTAGRGQRGRRWHSASSDITFSLARRMLRPLRELPALALVAGVAVATALRELGVRQTALKWPNDLMVEGAKLGGILVETRTEAGATRAVFGVGINCLQRAGLSQRLRRPVAALDQFIQPSRNAVIGALGRNLMAELDRFEAEGFDCARRQWEAMDAHAGQRLRVRLTNGRSVSGIDRGLAADGALRLLTRGGERALHNGRIVSARIA